MKRLLIFLCAALIFSFAFLKRELIGYIGRQAAGQFKIIWYSRSVDDVLADPSFPDSLKAKIRMVQEVRRFGVDSIGLLDTKNYTTLYDQHGKPLLWVLTASERYRLRPKEWSFPLIGKVTYKGFFSRAEALSEEKNLKEEGYDTDVGNVGGWSTLGWFRDPLLSGMLHRSDGALANLILHELTHATVYVKGNPVFNENIATFIGNKGAFLFLQHKYGKESRQYSHYAGSMEDEKLFNQFILKSAHRLDSLYVSFEQGNFPETLKDSLKTLLLRDIFAGADTLSLHDAGRYRKLYRRKELPGNAFFISFREYDSRQDSLEAVWREKFREDTRSFMEYFRSAQ